MKRLIQRLQQNLKNSKDESRCSLERISDYNNERDLLVQKCENLEISLLESKEREKNLTLEIKEQRKDLLKKMKDCEDELESKCQDLKEKLEEAHDKLIDLESQIEKSTQIAEWDQLKQQEIKKQIDSSLEYKDEIIEELRTRIADLENQLSNNSLTSEDDRIVELKDEIKNLEENLQNALEDSKLISTKLDKANALHAQKENFYESQLKEVKAQNEDSHKAHESLMIAFQALEAQTENSNFHEIIDQFRTDQQEELSSLQQKHQEIRQSLQNELDQVTEKCNKVELESRVTLSDYEKENSLLKDQLEELKKTKAQLSKDYKTLEQEKQDLIKNIEDYYKEKVAQLEDQIQEKNKYSQDAMEDIQTVSEKKLEELKSFYEEEKNRLEQKLQNEKESSKRKLQAQKEEFEDQLREEEEMHEEELYKQLEAERANAYTKIKYLEDSLEQARKSHSEFIEKQMDRFTKEKEDYRVEIEKEFQKKKEDLDKTTVEIDHLNSIIQELRDDIMRQKLDFTREEAIIKQKVQFKDEKIQELTSANSELTEQCRKKVDIEKMDMEISRITEKYENQRKASKEIENDFNKLKAEKDRSSIIYEQKIFNLENNLKKANEKYEQEISKIKDEIINIPRIQDLEQENGELKTRLLDTERDLNELASNYDRDKALWEDRFDFLENQKQQAKADLQDAHRKFEMTVEQLRRKDSNDRGKTESAQMLLITSIETKYKDQIKDITNSHAQLIQEIEKKYKKLEKEHKELIERYEIDTRGNISEIENMETRMKELLENEEILIKEIRELKNQRDRRGLEYQAVHERDKEIYKQRQYEIEKKYKALENKKNDMLFEFEKEKARWTLEEDNFTNKIDELTEALKKAIRKKDMALKENQKLKLEYKSKNRYNTEHHHPSTMVQSVKNGSLTAKKIELNLNDSSKYSKMSRKGSKFIGDYSIHNS